MQLEQQETFEIKSPQLEVFGQVESKLPAPAKKRPFAAGFLAVMVLVSVFGIGGVQLKSRYRNGIGGKKEFARCGINFNVACYIPELCCHGNPCLSALLWFYYSRHPGR